MAKSKSGGTRSYIRGRVGADVYSIGRDAKGAKQQVVRSLAETVANPQTVAQMRGRMIMSTVMQAVSAMRQIIDHSFDNVPTGQPCISEFISRNYALIKADVAAHPASDNTFGLNAYLEKGIKQGAFLLSDGEAINKGLVWSEDFLGFGIALTADTLTVAGLKAAIGWKEGDYHTLCQINADGTFSFARLALADGLKDETAITSANVGSLFTQEGNAKVSAELSDNNIAFSFSAASFNAGVIYSSKTAAGYVHSTCQLHATSYPSYCADVVLPSYPVGTAMFLNGGDL